MYHGNQTIEDIIEDTKEVMNTKEDMYTKEDMDIIVDMDTMDTKEDMDTKDDMDIIEDMDIMDTKKDMDTIEDMDTKVNTKMEAMVVGGNYARIENYPHAVFVLAVCKEVFICGSSVVNHRILLTAAHCVEYCKGRGFKIDAYAGSVSYDEPNVIRKVSKYLTHTDYDGKLLYADIALLSLQQNMPLNKYTKRVILRKGFPQNTDCEVAGWGATSENKGASTTKLKVVKQKVWSQHECNKHQYMFRGIICASSGSKNHYPFSGDSGSALITINHQQLGLVSFRNSHKPELIMYTNVSYYYTWIEERARKLYCNYK